jgi:hypothetical protein
LRFFVVVGLRFVTAFLIPRPSLWAERHKSLEGPVTLS